MPVNGEKWGNTATCPICGRRHDCQAKRYADGWHDVIVCCERTWDVCCQLEFRNPFNAVVAAHYEQGVANA
jgi:hypothetical protein